MITLLAQPTEQNRYRISACEGERVLGTAEYRAEGETVWLTQLDCPIEALADGLMRACLNAARAQGCVQAVCALPQWLEWLQKQGFSVQNGQASVSIGAFFARGCHR